MAYSLLFVTTLKTFLFLLIFIFTTQIAQAANKHEHFRSLFLPSNFTSPQIDVFSIPNDQQQLIELVGNFESLLTLLKVSLGMPASEVSKIISAEDFAQLSIHDLCKRLPGDPIENFKKLITIPRWSKDIDKSEYRRAYVIQEDIRSAWIKNLPWESLAQLYKNYFESDDRTNWSEIDITLSDAYINGEQKQRYALFLEIAKSYGAKIKTYVSSHRNKIETAARILLSQPTLAGVDITTSMFEDDIAREIQKSKSSDLASLQALFEVASTTGQELRIHAFEATNSGPFYDVLQKVLSQHKRPIKIRIGHLYSITPTWLKLLSKNKNLQVRFDVNPVSNALLQGADNRRIIEKIKLVHSYGFATDLGSDGRGILPNSSYTEQVARFEKMGYSYQCVKFYWP